MVVPIPSTVAPPVCCPACGSPIKAHRSARNLRVRCPKCREVVILKSTTEPPPEPRQPADPAADQAARLRLRIETLEARVAMLERVIAPGTGAAAGHAMEKAAEIEFGDIDLPPDVSRGQAGRLRRNLSAVRPHRITIQFPVGDGAARASAEWFKKVFEQAHWTVQGLEEATAGFAARGISFFASLPVSRDVAATFLALKKAGFDLDLAFDADLTGDEERLMVPQKRAPQQEASGQAPSVPVNIPEEGATKETPGIGPTGNPLKNESESSTETWHSRCSTQSHECEVASQSDPPLRP